MAAGIHASSWHSLTRVCLTPTSAARPPAAFRSSPQTQHDTAPQCDNFITSCLNYFQSPYAPHHVVQQSRVRLLGGGAARQPHADLAVASYSVTVHMDAVALHPKQTCGGASPSQWLAHAASQQEGCGFDSRPGIFLRLTQVHLTSTYWWRLVPSTAGEGPRTLASRCTAEKSKYFQS